MPMRDIYRPAAPYKTAQAEVEATPTAREQEGMQVTTPFVPHDKAWPSEFSSQFDVLRVAVGIGVTYQHKLNIIPRSWAVYVNANSGAGAIAQIQSGGMDISLTLNNGVLFPGRSEILSVTATIAIANVTIIALGDDKLRL